MFKANNRRVSRIIITLILSCIAAFLGFVTARAWNGSKSVFISGRNPFVQVADFLFGGDTLIGESRGQINILLLGVGGAGHDGPYLTDTIIVASVKPGTNEAALFSIPRDTITNVPGVYGKYKINHIYALSTAKYGLKKGLEQTRQAISEFTGLNIPYAVVVDFDGFIKAVDHLGGIDVQIDKTFTDSQYPNNKLGFIPPVTFKTGVEHMNGTRSLIYARSRYSTSDFDRARRQQRIIEAFGSRAKELNLLRDINIINKLFDDFSSHVVTNLEPGEIRRLGQIGTQIKGSNIYTTVLDPTTGLVCSYLSSELGYHLNPCPGKSLDDIQKFVELQFARGHVASEQSVVEVQNATAVEGHATTAAEHLEGIGFKAVSANAARLSDPGRTIIYDLTNGQKPDSLAVLLVTLGGTVGKQAPVAKTSPSPDFIVVLGRDYKPPFLDVINLDPPKPKEGNDEDDDDTERNLDTLPEANIKKANPTAPPVDDTDKSSSNGSDPEQPLNQNNI